MKKNIIIGMERAAKVSEMLVLVLLMALVFSAGNSSIVIWLAIIYVAVLYLRTLK